MSRHALCRSGRTGRAPSAFVPCLFEFSIRTRLTDHRNGQAARLTEVAKERGIPFILVRVWAGGRCTEKRLKRRKNGRTVSAKGAYKASRGPAKGVRHRQEKSAGLGESGACCGDVAEWHRV